MSTRPDYDFHSAEYDRPNQTWTCGGEADGLPCPLGPSLRGECRAACTPIREGDRYYCNHASERLGACDEGPLADGSCCRVPHECTPSKRQDEWVCNRGRCRQGPLPDGTCSQKFAACSPVRSVLAKRRIVVGTTVGLAIGVLLIATSSPQRLAIISPGDLTSHHQALNSCKDCHETGDGHLVNWVQAAFAGHADAFQSQRCLNCHRDDVGNAPMLAHGVDANTLEGITRSSPIKDSGAPFVLALARATRPNANQDLTCATCHREHRGRNFDMSILSDMQCQICHAETFHSFSSDHPPFDNYPYELRPHLYFDHRTHQNYFASRKGLPADATVSWNCSICHTPGTGGNAMLSGNYEKSCATCHDDQINSVVIPGAVFFALPAIDVTTLAQHDLDIGNWPRTYPKHAEASGWLSPLTDLLLESDPQYAAARQTIDHLDLSDLRHATSQDLVNVRKFVLAFKKALREVVNDGQAKFDSRLNAALGTNHQSYGAGDLFFERLVAAQQLWLPRLTEVGTSPAGPLLSEENPSELNTADSGESGSAFVSPAWLEEERNRIRGTRSGWYLRDSDLSLRYRPSGHADAWIKSWLETSAQSMAQAALMTEVFETLSSPTAPGRCMKCHTAEASTEGAAIDWRGRPPNAKGAGFTRFSHAPHLFQHDVDNCQVCHQIDVEQARDGLFHSSFIHADWSMNTNVRQAISDFVPIAITTCSKCHTSEGADDSCLTCHSYHVKLSQTR